MKAKWPPMLAKCTRCGEDRPHYTVPHHKGGRRVRQVCIACRSANFKSQSRAWKCWRGMCNRAGSSYPKGDYRHVTVCDRWKEFENFYADMGDPPPGHSIDRINNAGNYEPGNCRWATQTQQNRNRSNCHYIEWNGRRLSASEWADVTGISVHAIRMRSRAGWPVERLLTEPTWVGGRRPQVVARPTQLGDQASGVA